MKKYTVYFDVFGKKLKTSVVASNEEEAKRRVLDKIVFDKVEPEKNNLDDMIDMFKKIFQ